jgi:hypothetical protein
MTQRRALALSASVLLTGLFFAIAPIVRAAADTLPARLSDEELWKLSQELSEQDGFFRSDNLLSNELWLQWVIPDLLARTKPGGGVYLGVGPEQNFTYIAALKPKMVFITDIRRGNLHTQLMYKALFETSADRAEFIGKLFTKPRPQGLSARSTAREIMDAYWDINTSMEPTYRANLQAIVDHLTKKRKLPLSKLDLDGIEWVYYNFWWWGPSITYNSSTSGGRGGGNSTTYYDLMTATDAAGLSRSFLANEENFKVLKDLHEKNLIVPAVGDFGGPKALRAVGKFVRDHGATVTAFYLSNVEQYLRQDGKWNLFCGNVASMPLDERSTFIRSGQGFGGGGGRGLSNSLGSMLSETRGCTAPSPAAPRPAWFVRPGA